MTLTPSDFEPQRFERGQTHRFSLAVGHDLDLPLLLCRGRRNGPTLVVSANVHGDEYEGVRAIFEFVDDLDPTLLSGDLLAAPVVNPPAFWSGTRTSPIDGENLARVFPGAPDGTISRGIAYHFAHSVIARADFYLDLHSGGLKFRMPSMAGYFAGNPKARAAAEIFGAPVIWGHPTVEPGRTVSFAQERSIPWLYTEARGAGRIHPLDLIMMKRGIGNLMRHLGMLPGEPTVPAIQYRLFGDGNTDEGLKAKQPGFLINEVQILDRVAAGRRLGRLVDLHGHTLEEYRAPTPGLVGLIREFPVVQAHDSLYLIAGISE